MTDIPKPPRNALPKLNPEVVQELRDDLVRFLTRRTAGDAALAQDLGQESLVRVLQGLPQFRGAATLRTWARRIADNVWRDHMRRLGASPVERAAAGDKFSVGAILDAMTPEQTVPRPEATLDRAATHNCLLNAVRQLALDRRRIVLLHDFGEMPLDEIAKVLGCSAATAKVRLHRARRQLGEICRAQCESDTGPEGTLLCSPKLSSRRSGNTALARKPAQKGRR